MTIRFSLLHERENSSSSKRQFLFILLAPPYDRSLMSSGWCMHQQSLPQGGTVWYQPPEWAVYLHLPPRLQRGWLHRRCGWVCHGWVCGTFPIPHGVCRAQQAFKQKQNLRSLLLHVHGLWILSVNIYSLLRIEYMEGLYLLLSRKPYFGDSLGKRTAEMQKSWDYPSLSFLCFPFPLPFPFPSFLVF